jgi:hypothetical protein
MKRSIFIIKVFILLKAILAVLLLISILALASELWTTRNQIEGRELISTEPKGLAPLLVTLLSVIITLLFDFKVLKLKRTLAYKHWSGLLLLTVGVIIVSIWLKIQWLTICLMLLLSLYTIYLLFKFSSDKNES